MLSFFPCRFLLVTERSTAEKGHKNSTSKFHLFSKENNTLNTCKY